MTLPEAAVAIVEAEAPEPCVLLIRRTERQGDSWSGHWSFPGGRKDAEDSGPLHTALRELEEECGIRLLPGQMVAALPVRPARRRVGRFIPVAPFHFRVKCQLKTSLSPGEAVEALWVPLAILRDPARHCLRPVPGIPEDMLYPAVNLTTTPLWGFTYRLITAWLGMEDARPQAGKEAAHHVLEFVLKAGLGLRKGWTPGTGDPLVVEAAEVTGPIPVEAVLAHFAGGVYLPAVNRLWVRPESILVAGPNFEEYLIKGG